MNDLASKCRVLGAWAISHVQEAIAYKEGALPIDGARERVPGAAQAIAISQGPLLNSCEPFFPPIDIITRDQIAWVQPLPPAGEEKATIEQTRVGKPFEAAMRPDLIERIRKAE
jgi:hypothetical protein